MKGTRQDHFIITLQLRQFLVCSYSTFRLKMFISIFAVFLLWRCTCNIVWSCYLFSQSLCFVTFLWMNVQMHHVKLSIYAGLTCKFMSYSKFWFYHFNICDILLPCVVLFFLGISSEVFKIAYTLSLIAGWFQD